MLNHERHERISDEHAPQHHRVQEEVTRLVLSGGASFLSELRRTSGEATRDLPALEISFPGGEADARAAGNTAGRTRNAVGSEQLTTDRRESGAQSPAELAKENGLSERRPSDMNSAASGEPGGVELQHRHADTNRPASNAESLNRLSEQAPASELSTEEDISRRSEETSVIRQVTANILSNRENLDQTFQQYVNMALAGGGPQAADALVKALNVEMNNRGMAGGAQLKKNGDLYLFVDKRGVLASTDR